MTMINKMNSYSRKVLQVLKKETQAKMSLKRQDLLDAASDMFRGVTGYNSLCKSGCNKSTPLDLNYID